MDNQSNQMYAPVGACWQDGDKISCKLNNGKRMMVFTNKRKINENHPDFNLSMKYEDAEALGLLGSQR